MLTSAGSRTNFSMFKRYANMLKFAAAAGVMFKSIECLVI